MSSSDMCYNNLFLLLQFFSRSASSGTSSKNVAANAAIKSSSLSAKFTYSMIIYNVVPFILLLLKTIVCLL